MYSGRMFTFEILWRSVIVFLLAFLAWNYFLGGAMLVSVLLFLCLPIWLYITLYSLNYI